MQYPQQGSHIVSGNAMVWFVSSRKKGAVKRAGGWFGLPRTSQEERAEALERLRARFGDLVDTIPDAYPVR